MDWQAFFKSLLQVEEAVVPIFVHNPQSQKIAAVIMAAESTVPAIVGTVLPGQAAAAAGKS